MSVRLRQFTPEQLGLLRVAVECRIEDYGRVRPPDQRTIQAVATLHGLMEALDQDAPIQGEVDYFTNGDRGHE